MKNNPKLTVDVLSGYGEGKNKDGIKFLIHTTYYGKKIKCVSTNSEAFDLFNSGILKGGKILRNECIKVYRGLNKEYPRIDGHRKHYAMMPFLCKDGKYRGAEVVKGGLISPEENPIKMPFDTFNECHEGCKIHNRYHGFTRSFIRKLYQQKTEAAV